MLNGLNKICDRFTKLLVVWVLLAVGIGYFLPACFTPLKSYTNWLFAFTMLGIGAVLSLKDFEPLVKKPQMVILGTIAQFAIMPALGFAVAKLLRLPPDLAIGVILVGAVPGAMASNVISYLAKADVAYSVALTSTSTFLSPLLTPLFTYIFARSYIKIDIMEMFYSIVIMVILPLLVGLTAKHYLKERLEKINDLFPAVSTLFIAFICGLVVALNKDYLAQISLLIFVVVFLHNSFGLLLGYLAGVLYRFDVKRCRTLAFEVGMQNAGLGAVLALKHFSAQAALPNALFACWCIITASVLAEVWSRRPPADSTVKI